MVWLKNPAYHALLKFKIVLAGNPFWVKLMTPNLVESWKLMSTTTGKNLVLISQTTFEKFINNQNLLFPLFLQWYVLYLQMYKMYHWRYKENNRFWLILNFSKVVWDINTKFLPVVVLIRIQLSTKFGASRYTTSEGAWRSQRPLDRPASIFNIKVLRNQNCKGYWLHIFKPTPRSNNNILENTCDFQWHKLKVSLIIYYEMKKQFWILFALH